MKLNTKKTEGEKQGIKCCACYCHIQGILCEQCEYDVCDLEICQPTEKPMDWEERFDEKWDLHTGEGGFHIGCYECKDGTDKDEVKHYIKDLLKEERMHAEVETGLRAFPIVLEEREKYLAEYKQKLIKRIKDFKVDVRPEITKWITHNNRQEAVTYNNALELVEAVIREEEI